MRQILAPLASCNTFRFSLLNVNMWDLMCLMGGTAYHFEQTKHWWDCFPPGPTWDLVNLLIICSIGTFPRRSFKSGGSASCLEVVVVAAVAAPGVGVPGLMIGLEDTDGKLAVFDFPTWLWTGVDEATEVCKGLIFGEECPELGCCPLNLALRLACAFSFNEICCDFLGGTSLLQTLCQSVQIFNISPETKT